MERCSYPAVCHLRGDSERDVADAKQTITFAGESWRMCDACMTQIAKDYPARHVRVVETKADAEARGVVLRSVDAVADVQPAEVAIEEAKP